MAIEDSWESWHAAEREVRLARAEELGAPAELQVVGINDAGLVRMTDQRDPQRTFVLVPGLRVRLGWDRTRFSLGLTKRARWMAEMAARWGDPRTPEAQMDEVFGPAREVALPAVVVQSHTWPTQEVLDACADPDGDDDADRNLWDILNSWLAVRGERLPTADEWEAWYRAGTSTVFPWGNAWEKPEYWPNPWGVEAGGHPYSVELVAGRRLRGGDGGHATHGGMPQTYALHTFASAFAPPLEPDEDWKVWFEVGAFRAVLTPGQPRPTSPVQEPKPPPEPTSSAVKDMLLARKTAQTRILVEQVHTGRFYVWTYPGPTADCAGEWQEGWGPFELMATVPDGAREALGTLEEAADPSGDYDGHARMHTSDDSWLEVNGARLLAPFDG